MDFLYQHEVLSTWLIHYGSIALFFLLAAGIVALPVPDETLMVLAGVLMYDGHLSVTPTVIATVLGSISGITLSYVLGKSFGKYCITRYGSWFGLTKEKVHRVNDWFHHFGRWTLFFGYFIPGIRHFTGIIAGSIGLEYGLFALFAYAGAFVWASFFLSLGYFFSDYWMGFFEWLEGDIDEAIVALVLICLFLAIARVVWKKKS